MIVPPSATGARGIRMPTVENARESSNSPTSSAIATTAMKASLTTKTVAPTSTSRPRPTAIDAGRLRPARLVFGGTAGVSSAGDSDLKELCLFVLHELVDHVDVLLCQPVEPLLGADVVVLADLGVLLGPVERLLRGAAQAAYAHAPFLRLGPGKLDVLLAAVLGQLGQRHAQHLAVVGGI